MATIYAFTPHCHAVLQQIRTTYPRRELTPLFQATRHLAVDPLLPGSGLSYHDPQYPEARFYRVPSSRSSSQFTIFYRVADDGIVIFTNVWSVP
jgi:hypothetical protein